MNAIAVETMPRHKHYFRVSHDINRDPDLWDLEAKHGEKVLRIWLEILSVADRNEGAIPGEFDSISLAVSGSVRCRKAKVKSVLSDMITIGWLSFSDHNTGTKSPQSGDKVTTKSPQSDCLRVSKWLEYNKTRDANNSPPSQPSQPSEPAIPKEQGSSPVDKSNIKNLYPQTEADDLVHLAIEVAAMDKSAKHEHTARQLCQWTIVMVHAMTRKNEPQARIDAVVRAALLNVRRKIESGYEIKSLTGLLSKIFDDERTKYMQGPEHQKNKNAPIGSLGAILDKIAAGAK